MSIIQAYKSDMDGKVFEFKSDYTKHLRKLADKRREEKRMIQHKINRELFLDKMGQVGSFDELEQFIKDNWQFFRMNAQERDFGRRFRKGDDELINLSLSINGFSQSCSNSHKCPRKGQTNWGGYGDKDNVPRSYPGWRGRITFSVTHSTSFGSNYFEGTPLGTGSGGGGDECKSYDLQLWAADFPVLWEKHCRDSWVMRKNQERQHVWRSLGGKGLVTPFTDADVPLDFVIPDPLKS